MPPIGFQNYLKNRKKVKKMYNDELRDADEERGDKQEEDEEQPHDSAAAP